MKFQMPEELREYTQDEMKTIAHSIIESGEEFSMDHTIHRDSHGIPVKGIVVITFIRPLVKTSYETKNKNL